MTGTSVTVADPGTAASSTITITPSGGFAGSVALACSLTTSPAGASEPPTCSVAQPAAISATSAVTATLTVNTTGSSTATLHNPLRQVFRLGGGTMAVLVFFAVPFRRRKWQTMLGVILLWAAAMGATGCGGAASTDPPPNAGTTAGAYVITVTGTSGTITQTAKVAVTVQ
jgi:trimeric autotransporter adhesin